MIFKNTQNFELIHSDVYDSNKRPTHEGSHYFVTFINNFSKLCYTYLLKTKDEVFNKLKVYKVEIENECKELNKFQFLISNKLLN